MGDLGYRGYIASAVMWLVIGLAVYAYVKFY